MKMVINKTIAATVLPSLDVSVGSRSFWWILRCIVSTIDNLCSYINKFIFSSISTRNFVVIWCHSRLLVLHRLRVEFCVVELQLTQLILGCPRLSSKTAFYPTAQSPKRVFYSLVLNLHNHRFIIIKLNL